MITIRNWSTKIYSTLFGFLLALPVIAIFLLYYVQNIGSGLLPVDIIQDFNSATPDFPIPNGWTWKGSNGANLSVHNEPDHVSEGNSALRITFGETIANWAEGYVGLINLNSGGAINFSNSDGIAFDVMGNFAADAGSITFRWHLRSEASLQEFAQQDTLTTNETGYKTVNIPWAAFKEFEGHSGNTFPDLLTHWSSNGASPLKELGVAIVIEVPGSGGTIFLDNIHTYKKSLLSKAIETGARILN